MDMRIVRFLKDWTLIISILAGIFGYFIYTGIPALEPTRAAANRAVAIVQPLLIFAMLFSPSARSTRASCVCAAGMAGCSPSSAASSPP